MLSVLSCSSATFRPKFDDQYKDNEKVIKVVIVNDTCNWVNKFLLIGRGNVLTVFEGEEWSGSIQCQQYVEYVCKSNCEKLYFQYSNRIYRNEIKFKQSERTFLLLQKKPFPFFDDELIQISNEKFQRVIQDMEYGWSNKIQPILH